MTEFSIVCINVAEKNRRIAGTARMAGGREGEKKYTTRIEIQTNFFFVSKNDRWLRKEKKNREKKKKLFVVKEKCQLVKANKTRGDFFPSGGVEVMGVALSHR